MKGHLSQSRGVHPSTIDSFTPFRHSQTHPQRCCLEDNFVVSLLVLWSFLIQCSAQTHQLRSIPIPCDGFTWFQQLIIHQTELVPSNVEENLGTVSIRSGHRRKACSGIPHDFLRLGLSQWTHFSSLVTMRCENPFRFCLRSSCLHAKKRRSTCLAFNPYETQFPYFWIILMALMRFEMTCWVTPNDSANYSCIWHESSASNASNSESAKKKFFPPLCRSSTLKLPLLKRWNHWRHVPSLRAASP